MLFCHKINIILIINALLWQNLVVEIYALFLPIFLGWQIVPANFFAFWMYGPSLSIGDLDFVKTSIHFNLQMAKKYGSGNRISNFLDKTSFMMKVITDQGKSTFIVLNQTNCIDWIHFLKLKWYLCKERQKLTIFVWDVTTWYLYICIFICVYVCI